MNKSAQHLTLMYALCHVEINLFQLADERVMGSDQEPGLSFNERLAKAPTNSATFVH